MPLDRMAGMAVRLTAAGDRPFVGRARELSLAAGILTDPDRAGVILIGGESGLGKTRLAQEIASTAHGTNSVLWGGAVPRATPIPFELVGRRTLRSLLAPTWTRGPRWPRWTR